MSNQQGQVVSALCRRGGTTYQALDWNPSLFNKVFRQSSSSKDSFTIWEFEERIIVDNACIVMAYTPCWR